MATIITPIITKADFAPYVDVAANLQDVKVNPRILEAQTFDLKPLFGVAMYQDYFDTPLTYELLTPYIKPVLVYFSCARLIKSLDLHITPNGIMQKRNEYSDHMDIKAIDRMAVLYQNLAIGYWGEAQMFINEQGKSVYPLYEGFNVCGYERSDVRPRIFGIGGRDVNGR